MSKIKKVFIYIGITVGLCLATALLSICISRKGDTARNTDLEQQLKQQTTSYRELLNSTAIGNREMARNLEATKYLNRQLIEGLKGSRNINKENIERLRGAVDDSRRVEQIIESLLSEN